MGGQIWGGGVVVLVAVALWLLYLLPSWQSRHQYDSATRNAVRLNQALRVLAETSETPQEVRLELNARTALAQQRLAKRALAAKEQAELATARAEAQVVRARSKAEADASAARAKAELEAARAAAAAEREAAVRRAAAARALPAARRARARRRVRLTATFAVVLGIAASGAGGWMLLASGSSGALWGGGVTVAVGVLVLARMSRVASRAASTAVRVESAVAEEVQDLALPVAAKSTWEPRRLPRPLASSAGSRASAVLDGAAAREALRDAAREEAARVRAEKDAPPSIAVARAVREAGRPATSPFATMGYVDDAEIEAHVRRLLESRRASA